MKLLKRIGITAIFLVMLFPISNVFASELDYFNGYFDNHTENDDYSVRINNSSGIFQDLIDNNLDTGIKRTTSGASHVVISFVNPTDISHLYAYFNNTTINVTTKSNETYELAVSEKSYIEVNYEDVTEISINLPSGSQSLYEFEIFTNDNTPEPDSDGDGIPDNEDKYPEDPTNTPPPADSDGDGIPDNEDEYPEDPNDGKPLEVRNLEMQVSEKRVDLSWEKPPSNFDKAIIYRKKLGTTQTASIFSLFTPMKVSAAEEYIPLFETNGTTFSDLTIEPETEYQYKVTSEFNGIESEGVTTTVSTPKAPPIDFSEIEMPFGVKELISSGNGLLGIIAGFVLLALSFVFVPKVIRLIKSAFRTPEYKGQPMAERIQQDRETEKANRQQAKAERREKREARAGRQSSYIPREPRQSKRG